MFYKKCMFFLIYICVDLNSAQNATNSTQNSYTSAFYFTNASNMTEIFTTISHTYTNNLAYDNTSISNTSGSVNLYSTTKSNVTVNPNTVKTITNVFSSAGTAQKMNSTTSLGVIETSHKLYIFILLICILITL